MHYQTHNRLQALHTHCVERIEHNRAPTVQFTVSTPVWSRHHPCWLLEQPNLAPAPCRATNLHLTLHAQFHRQHHRHCYHHQHHCQHVWYAALIPTPTSFLPLPPHYICDLKSSSSSSPAVLSHSQILTPRVRPARPPNCLIPWIGRFPNVEIFNLRASYNLNWKMLNNLTRLYQLYPDVNNLNGRQRSNTRWSSCGDIWC